MDQETLHRYAKILLAGLGFRADDRLFLRTEPVHWDLAKVVVEEAYRQGARYVEVSAIHPDIPRLRIDHASEESLTYIPDHIREHQKKIVEEGWAYLVLEGSENPWSMEDVDQRRNGIVGRARSEANAEFLRALQADRFPWLVAAVPTDAWAYQVIQGETSKESFLGSSRDGELEKLWQLLRPILKIDQDDPVAAWRAQAYRLDSFAHDLSQMDIDELHFTGPGTDLRIGLPVGARWIGGSSYTPDGRMFIPNIPTEEVFTAPDFRRTSGVVAVTRPVSVLGTLVDGIRFTFEDGRLASATASRGQDALNEFLRLDPNAGALGEVALVDAASAIARSGKLFYNILFDENAASHIALGGAYASCIPGGNSLSEEALRDAGLNTAAVHIDFMIGSAEMDITATTTGGKTLQLMRGGRFVDH